MEKLRADCINIILTYASFFFLPSSVYTAKHTLIF